MLKAVTHDFIDLKSTAEIEKDKASTDVTRLKATIEDVLFIPSNTIQAESNTKLSLSASINKIVRKDLQLNDSISINSQTTTIKNILSKPLSKTFSLRGQSLAFTELDAIKLSNTLTLISSTGYESIKSNKLSKSFLLTPSTVASVTELKSINDTISLFARTEVRNQQDVKIVNDVLTFIPDSSAKIIRESNNISNTVSLSSQTNVESITILVQESNTLSFLPVSEINFNRLTKQEDNTLSLSQSTNYISTKRNTISDTISLSSVTDFNSLKNETQSATISLSPQTETFNAQNVATVFNTISLITSTRNKKSRKLVSVENTISLNSESQIESLTVFGSANNTLSLSPQSTVQSVTIFGSSTNQINLSPQTQVDFDLEFFDVINTIVLSESTQLNQVGFTTTVSNTLSLSPQSIVEYATPIQSQTSITLSPSTQEGVYDQQLIQPKSTSNNDGWQSATQGIITEDISGETPDDNSYISHFSLNPSRSVTIDYSEVISVVGNKEGNTVKIRFRSTSGLGSVNFKVELISQGFSIKSQTYNNVGTSFITRDITLDQQTLQSLDYNDMQLKITASTNDSSNRFIEVSWAVIDIPNVEQ